MRKVFEMQGTGLDCVNFGPDGKVQKVFFTPAPTAWLAQGFSCGSEQLKQLRGISTTFLTGPSGSHNHCAMGGIGEEKSHEAQRQVQCFVIGPILWLEGCFVVEHQGKRELCCVLSGVVKDASTFIEIWT